MKIFEFRIDGEKEWVSGKTIVEALKLYCNFTDMSLGEFEDEDDIAEIPEKEWCDYSVKYEDGLDQMNSWKKTKKRQS